MTEIARLGEDGTVGRRVAVRLDGVRCRACRARLRRAVKVLGYVLVLSMLLVAPASAGGGPLPPLASIGDVSVKEGDRREIMVVEVPVTLSQPALTGGAPLQVTIVEGTAKENEDYTNYVDYGPDSQTVSISPGASTATVRIGVYGDTQFEPDETFSVNIATLNASVVQIADGSATVTILNDDLPDAPEENPTQGGCATGEVPEVRVGNALVVGCFTERKDDQGKVTGEFETGRAAWVGGFPVEPAAGGKFVVRPKDTNRPFLVSPEGADLVFGSVRVPVPGLTLDDLVKPFASSYVLSLNAGGSFDRLLTGLAKVPLLSSAGGQAKVSWTDGGRAAKIEAQVPIEEITKSLGPAYAKSASTSVGTLAGKLTLTLANGKAASAAGGEVQIPEFATILKDTRPALKLGFGGMKLVGQVVDGKVQWSGEATTLFPWMGSQGALTGRIFLTDGQLSGIGLALSGFERRLSPLWALTGVEGNVILSPAFAFDVGISAQSPAPSTKVKPKPISFLKVTGNLKAFRLAAQDCRTGTNPIALVINGNIPEMELQGYGKGRFSGKMCQYLGGDAETLIDAGKLAFELGGNVELTFDLPLGLSPAPTPGELPAAGATKLALVRGSASGWFSGSSFNLDVSEELQLPVIGTIAGSGLLSSEGYGFCGTYGFLSAGIAGRWNQAPQDLTGCDFTPYRAAVSAQASRRARAAAGERTVRVPAGQSAVALELKGDTGAPRVTVVGPKGERFQTPAGASALKSADAIIVPVDELKTTTVFLKRPATGTWRLEPTEGSPAISAVRSATQLPKAKVTAKASAKNGKVTVRWKAKDLAGRSVQLVDRAAGVATVIQKPTTKSSGTVRFTAASPLAAKREIQALITLDGRPQATLTAGRYRLKAPAKPARITKLKAKRTKKALTLTWKSAERAATYTVTIAQGKTVLTRAITRKARLTYTAPPASGPLTITIQPADTLARNGPATKVTLKAPKTKTKTKT